MKHIIFTISILFSLTSIGQELTKNVYFEIDSFTLTQESKKVLDEFLPSIHNKKLEIKGFTDSTGSTSYNTSLSIKRANSVAEYLISNGVVKQNIKTLEGKGETNNASTFSQNRRVTITAANIELNQEHLSKTKDEELNQATIDKIKVGDILNIGGLEFHGGRHFLKSYSLPILDELTDILENNPSLKIEIQGHICCQDTGDGLDTDTGTYDLSENRAEAIYNELIERGISPERLSHKGYGSSRKIREEVDAESMQKNRRVSILIVKK